MAKFSVEVPFSGYVDVEVEADNESEAKEKGLEKAQNEIESADQFWNCIGEWDFHERIVKGNVCYAVRWEIDAQRIDE